MPSAFESKKWNVDDVQAELQKPGYSILRAWLAIHGGASARIALEEMCQLIHAASDERDLLRCSRCGTTVQDQPCIDGSSDTHTPVCQVCDQPTVRPRTRPDLRDVLLWADNHVEALKSARIAPWHQLRAQMIRDMLKKTIEPEHG